MLYADVICLCWTFVFMHVLTSCLLSNFSLSPENQARQREEWAKELVEIDLEFVRLESLLKIKSR